MSIEAPAAQEAQKLVEAWAHMHDLYFPDHGERWTWVCDALVERLEGRPPGVLVDLGCGAGNLTRALQERVPAHQVIGIDVDPALVALGTAAFVGGPRMVVGDESLVATFEGPIHAVVSSAFLHYSDEAGLARTRASLRDVLGEDGLLLEVDRWPFEAPEGDPWGDWWALALEDPWFAQIIATSERPPPMEALAELSLDGVESAYAAAGFGHVRRHPLTGGSTAFVAHF